MTDRNSRRSFVSRPADAEGWIKAANVQHGMQASADRFTARLTIDVTPELRGRIKVTAFQRGITVADMLRDLLAREFPETSGDAI